MSRKAQYQKYLKSKEWKLLRVVALERTGGLCQFCKQPATQVHHVQYPKNLGSENPDSLIPVCKNCHEVSHGIQEINNMSDLKNAEIMNDISPSGVKMKYLLAEAKVFASARSWSNALRIPKNMRDWFESGLARIAILKKDFPGGPLERTYLGRTVYRWPAVSRQLRAFDRQWYKGVYDSYTKSAKSQIDEFHDRYEKLLDWGDELQEKAIENSLNPVNETPSIENLQNVIQSVTSEVVHRQDLRLDYQDRVITHLDDKVTKIEQLVPPELDPLEFITIRKAIIERKFDVDEMPLFPQSKENLAGICGQILTGRGCKKGSVVNTRIDGDSLVVALNTYYRKEIYGVLEEVKSVKQESLDFE